MLSLPEPDGHGDVSEFDRMVAGDVPADRSVAANGQIIERQQILTTHKPGSPGEARRAARILDDLARCLQDEPVTPFTGWSQGPHWAQSRVPETDTPSWLSRAATKEQPVSKPPLAPELPPRPRPRVCLPGPGALTQLVECHLCKVEVRGSSPLCSTKTIGSKEAHWPAEETKVEDWDRPLATDPSPNIRLGMTATT